MQSTECVFAVCFVLTGIHHYQKQFSSFTDIRTVKKKFRAAVLVPYKIQ